MRLLQTHAQSPGALAVFLFAVAGACTPEISDSPLPERTVPADTSALPPHFASVGGPVLLRLTGWVKPEVLQQVRDAGMRPLPGGDTVAAMDSLGMNTVGGVVPPYGLESILRLRYIERIEPLEVRP